ncbi:Pkinase-domain-containing protein [Thozetella sp. PMI_491]|nr:Pkinase-domain-containing protein [Thozetella sp. PMI_491]
MPRLAQRGLAVVAAHSYHHPANLPSQLAELEQHEKPPTNPTHDQAAQPAVRFKSTIEEISPPPNPVVAAETTNEASNPPPRGLGNPGEVSPEELRALSKSLMAAPLQERRMNIFAYEPFSLPASRTASHEDESGEASRQGTRSSGEPGRHSPLLSPRSADMHTPPLSPAATDSAEGEAKRVGRRGESDRIGRGPDIITPQESGQDSLSPHRPLARRPNSSEDVPQRPVTSDGRPHLVIGDHRKGLFSVGPSSPSSSVPVSRESSPSRPASQFYSRQPLPSGEVNDPYAADKRKAQKGIDSRFIFSRKKKSSPGSSTVSLPRGGSLDDELQQEETGGHSRHGSMSDLKRFFKLGAGSKAKRAASPAPSTRSGNKTPPSSRSTTQIPFGDDHGLTSKYGKLGKVLGAGAGGSVRLMKRSEDSVVFAVKEFRPRHSYETEREYVKKLTAEYCMGSSLHHGNIIETLDIVQEKGKWYEVMEYAPYDLFAIVMTGKMSREEISCCFLQILSGVTYLHSVGLAHRDLKLDNVVVSDHGIMKIIDFGSAHVFKYPFESGIVMATGIVGSDPYLAPEVYDERKYDPQAVDIWSLAIIFCCMTLRRFPWKVPRMTDSSFKLFAAEPSPGHDPKKLVLPASKSTNDLTDTPARDFDVQSMKASANKGGNDDAKSEHKGSSSNAGSHLQPGESAGEKREVIRGPWRILRLLPRESRHVIGRMLEIDPKKRGKMEDILEDKWVANTVICRQIEPGNVVNADDHTHILEPPASAK